MWKICRNPFMVIGFVLVCSLLVPMTHGQELERVEADVDYSAGLSLDLYELEHSLKKLATIVSGQTPNVSKRVATPRLDGPIDGYVNNYLVEITGQLLIEEAGKYSFELLSDDGSQLWLNGKRVIDNDGLHPMTGVIGVVELATGAHDLKIRYFQASGGQGLELKWRDPVTARWGDVPATAFRSAAGLTRVISPGPKRVVEAESLETPGDGAPLEALHPMWELTTLSPQGPEDFELKIGGMAYLPGEGGRLAISTFDPRNNGAIVEQPNGTLWMIAGVDGDPEKLTVEKIAGGLFNPLGVLYHEGDLLVAQRDEITRFHDADGSGRFAERSTLADGWTSDNYHHFTFGPVYKDGSLYASLSASFGNGAQKVIRRESFGFSPNVPGRGDTMKIDPATGDVEFITGGHRTPNGLFIGPDGELFVGENQGAWQPANKLNHIQPGAFYGHYNGNTRTEEFPEGAPPSDFSDQPLTPPAVYLPHNEIANSPTDGVVLPDGPFAGQILMSDVKHGGLRRLSLEKVNGQYQGVAFRHSQGFNAGINRLAFGADDTLFVGGIGERASWSWKGTREGLQRLTPTGKTTFEFQNITATADGLTLSYTRPVPAEQLRDLNGYLVKQWRYRPTSAYGGPKFDQEALEVTDAKVASDRRSVTLTIPGIKAGRVVHVHHNPTSDAGETMWSPEAWYTMNQLPGTPLTLAETQEKLVRVLVFSKTAGYRHDSIKNGVDALRRMAQQQAWDFIHTEDSTFFTDSDLEKFDAVIFLNTSDNVLDDEQQAAFERYIQNGGGFVGVHAATDTEYDWPWFNQLVGGYFADHPKVQPAEIDVLIDDHPSTEHLPERWARTDEWYNFKDMNDDVNVLLNLDETTYKGGKMGEDHPVAWYHEFDGGRSWYTAGGHTKESYSEREFLQHIEGGIRWAAGLAD